MPEFYPALITDTVASHACGIRMSPVTYKCHIFVFGSILAIMLRIAFSCWIIALALGVVPKAFAFGFVAPEEMEAGVAKCSGKNSVNSFECARGIEQKALSTEGKVVSRSGDALQIHTEKKIISLVDVIVDSWSNYISYSYLGYNQTINSHILHVQYYEGFAYMVIHHQSGEQASPSGFPLVSPDGKHFLSLSEDMSAGYNPNNIEIWSVDSGKYHRLANHEPDWGPRDGRWVSIDRAIIQKWCYAPSSSPTLLEPCGTASVERSGETWKLVE